MGRFGRSGKVVAHDCGFNGAEHMRLVFGGRLGITPSQYRAGFRASSLDRSSDTIDHNDNNDLLD
jgi:AraC-like DNA-binding protein